MKPLALAPNLVSRNYRGGDRIARLRAIEQSSEHQPEEWLAATVSSAGSDTLGLARTQQGLLLRDLIAADPAEWLGSDFEAAVSRSDTGILVKLLDARQRLPVHVHPTREFSATHLDCPYGKTEAWYVLETEPGAAVYLGWKNAVDSDELARRRDSQDSEWLLDHMNRIEVHPGMGILVPAGTVHAIDSGIFVAEVQEPTDFSIVLEWSVTTSSRDESHLGVGFETVMQTVSTEPTTAADLTALTVSTDVHLPAPSATSLLPAAADPFFRLHQVAPPEGEAVSIPAGFAVGLVLDGSGELAGADGEVTFQSGEVFAVPAAFGPWTARGASRLLVATSGAGWPGSLSAEQHRL